MKQQFAIPLIATFILLLFISTINFIGQDTDVAEAAPTFAYQAGFPVFNGGKSIEKSATAVVDIDGDGDLEILAGDNGSCVQAWHSDGRPYTSNGFPLMTLDSCSAGARIRGPIAVGDIDNDGRPEVVAGTRGLGNNDGERGKVWVWNHDGTVVNGWPREMDWNQQYANNRSEVSSVAIGNMTNDNQLEIIASTTNNAGGSNQWDQDTRNLYAWTANGQIMPGYPAWYRTAGIFGQVATANITGDNRQEVIVGRDHIYMHAYRPEGGYVGGQWPHHTYLNQDLTTWGQDRYVEFTSNAAVIADLDNSGYPEIIIAGKVRTPTSSGNIVTHSAVMVFQSSGARRAGWGGSKLSGPVVHDNSNRPSQAPAIADINGDGNLEIIVVLADGTVRAYDHTSRELWSYNFAQGRILHGSEPVVADVTGDGQLDILFGTYSPIGSDDEHAGLVGVDHNGNLLDGFPLATPEELTRNGARGLRAGISLADLDNDCDIEVIAASRSGHIYAWDFPGYMIDELMPWPMARHDLHRSGWYDNVTKFDRSPVYQRGVNADSTVYFPFVTFDEENTSSPPVPTPTPPPPPAPEGCGS